MSKISVVIPCYNYAKFLGEAIESALNQTVKADEIIVMNDNSKDNTIEVALKYPIKLINNRVNIGPIANFNKGVIMSSCDYIIMLGADNKLHKTYIEKTKKILDKNKNIAIVYTHIALFGPYARKIAATSTKFYIGKKGEYYLWKIPEFNRESLIKGNYINGSAMFRKKTFNEAGGFTKEYMPEDWGLWKRIVLNGYDAKLVPEYLLYYRQHSLTQRNIKLHKLRTIRKFIKNYFVKT